MSKIDIAIVIILVIGGYFGYKKGFLMELFFLVAIVLGVFVGFRLMGAGVDYLHREFNADTSLLPYISFLIIFILVVVGVTLAARLFKSSLDKTFLGRVDAIAGGILGLLKYMFCVSVVLWLLESVHYKLPVSWTAGSWLYPVTLKFAPAVAGLFGSILPVFKEIFREF